MKDSIVGFAEQYKLSPREAEILTILLSRIISIKDIASHLSLSPSTVNNHLNRIFEKTEAKSKADLLAIFLETYNKSIFAKKLLRRTPRVLVVDDEIELCELIASDLSGRGLKVYIEPDASKVSERVSELGLDFVVSDVRMPIKNGIDILKEVKQAHKYKPQFLFVTAYNDFEKEQLYDLGAIGVFAKPTPMDELYKTIMFNYIETEVDMTPVFDEHNSMKGLPALVFDYKTINTEYFGYGGLFYPVAFEKPEEMLSFNLSKKFKLEFRLSKEAELIKAMGEVVWRRTVEKQGKGPGVGIKITSISHQHKELLEEFSRKRKNLSYIPLGGTLDAKRLKSL